MSLSLVELREKARNEYGIANADDIKEKQLLKMIDSIDNPVVESSDQVEAVDEVEVPKSRRRNNK